MIERERIVRARNRVGFPIHSQLDGLDLSSMSPYFVDKHFSDENRTSYAGRIFISY
jgi:hypothetical protein